MVDSKYVKHVVQINSNFKIRCEHCPESVGGRPALGDSINHYLKTHAYKLLHVGQETTIDFEGNPWQRTVAVLGR